MKGFITVFLVVIQARVSQQQQCLTGTASSYVKHVTTYLCDVTDYRDVTLGYVNSDAGYNAGRYITEAECPGVAGDGGCEVTVPPGVELRVEATYFTRYQAATDHSTLISQCNSRVEVIDDDTGEMVQRICEAATKYSIQCHSRQKKYFITYSSSDASIQAIFSLIIYTGNQGNVSIRCGTRFIPSPSRLEQVTYPTQNPTFYPTSNHPGEEEEEEEKEENMSVTINTTDLVIIIIGVVVLLAVIFMFLYCCYWLRRVKDGDVQEPDNKPPVGSKIMIRIAETISRATGRKVTARVKAVAAGQGIPVSIDKSGNDVTPFSSNVLPTYTDVMGRRNGNVKGSGEVLPVSSDVMGRGDVSANPLLDVNKREVLKPSLDVHDPYKPTVMYASQDDVMISHGNVMVQQGTYPDQPEARRQAVVAREVLLPAPAANTPPIGDPRVLAQSSGNLHPGQQVMSFNTHLRPSTTGNPGDDLGSDGVKVEKVSCRPRQSILKQQMEAEMAETSVSAPISHPQGQGHNQGQGHHAMLEHHPVPAQPKVQKPAVPENIPSMMAPQGHLPTVPSRPRVPECSPVPAQPQLYPDISASQPQLTEGQSHGRVDFRASQTVAKSHPPVHPHFVVGRPARGSEAPAPGVSGPGPGVGRQQGNMNPGGARPGTGLVKVAAHNEASHPAMSQNPPVTSSARNVFI